MRRPVSYEYDQDKGPEPPGCLTRSFRWLLIVLNLFISFLGIGVVVFIIVIANRDEGTKGHQIYENCSMCKKAMIASAVIFGFVIISSFCGFIALCSRRSCLLTVYAVFGFLMFFLMGACTTGVILMQQGVFVDGLRQDWDAIEPVGRCKLETTFECSGWDILCDEETPTTTAPVPSTETAGPETTSFPPTTQIQTFQNGRGNELHVLPAGCADCEEDNVLIANYTETCKYKLQHSFDEGFVPLVVVSSAFTVICFAVMFVSCRLRVDDKKREDEVALLNERYV